MRNELLALSLLAACGQQLPTVSDAANPATSNTPIAARITKSVVCDVHAMDGNGDYYTVEYVLNYLEDNTKQTFCNKLSGSASDLKCPVETPMDFSYMNVIRVTQGNTYYITRVPIVLHFTENSQECKVTNF